MGVVIERSTEREPYPGAVVAQIRVASAAQSGTLNHPLNRGVITPVRICKRRRRDTPGDKILLRPNNLVRHLRLCKSCQIWVRPGVNSDLVAVVVHLQYLVQGYVTVQSNFLRNDVLRAF